MKDKIIKIFHTDTILGKVILFVSFYFIFWFLAYGIWNIGSWVYGFRNLLLSNFNILVLFQGLISLLIVIFNNFSVYSFLMLLIIMYFLLFIPILSFILLKKLILPCLYIKKQYLIYIFNTIFIFFSIWYFVYTAMSSINPSF